MSCPDCFSGHTNPSTPTGRVEKYLGFDCYIADPPHGATPQGIIVFFPDAFGLPFVNNKILADHYAAAGNWKVVFPDVMDGKPAPTWMMGTMERIMSTSTLWDWLTKPYDIACAIAGMGPFMYYNRIPASQPRVREFMLALRAEADNLKIPVGAAGFCWGGNHVTVLCKGATDTPLTKKGERPLVDAGFTAHPSFLNYPADIEAVEIPLSIAYGDHDMVNPMKDIEKAKEILEKKDVDTEVKIYYGAGHGFGVRADLGRPENEKIANECEQQAISWFKKHFAKVTFS